jgi:aminoglycoside phosphotransferase (APT) family kinase protein
MKSTSKVQVPQAELISLTKRAIGAEPRESVEITEGWFNTIYRLSFTDGARVGLKIAPRQQFQPMTYEKDLLHAEIGVQTLLVERGLRGTHVITEGRDPLAGEPMDWFMYHWVEGKNLAEARETMDDTAQQRADDEVAALSARINSIRGERFGRWHNDNCAAATWNESFTMMVEDLLYDAGRKSVVLPWETSELRALLAEAVPSLFLVRQPRLVIWDLHDGNVIVNPETGGVQAVIDGDRALWGDPLMEFCFRSFNSLSERWLKIYRDHMDEPFPQGAREGRDAQIRMAWYDLYLALVMVIESVYRRYPAGHDRWAREMGTAALQRLRHLFG